MDPDSNVLKLIKDLNSLEEATQQSLQPRKFKYDLLALLIYMYMYNVMLLVVHETYFFYFCVENELLLYTCYC